MTDAKKKIDLDRELLAWPQRESDARVEVILARLGTHATAGATASAISDEALVEPPTPPVNAEDDAVFVAPSAAAREQDREKLRAIAKMAPGLTPSAPIAVALRGREAREEDSGIVDLAAAANADPEAAVRARRTELASQDLFEDAPARSARGLASVPSMPSSMPSIPIVALSSRRLIDEVAGPASSSSSSSSSSAARGDRHANRGVPLYLAGMVAISAAAASFFFLMRGTPETTASVVATVTTTQVPPTASVAPDPASTSAPAPTATVVDAPATVSPVTTTSPATAAKSVVATRPEAVKPTMPKPAPTAPDVASPPRRETGDEAGDPVPAAGNRGSAAMGDVPQKPSQGAVTTALAAVLPEARTCLGPDDAPARATLVFGSSGAVQTVTVTSAGDAEACIKTALLRAKVTPFAEPSFTASANVRHN